MPNADLVLIDTSVWIDYFTHRNPSVERSVDHLIADGRIATAGIILAELNQGARTEREMKQIHECLKPVVWIKSDDQHWVEAGELSFELRKVGKGVNLTDCYIASLARRAKACIFSLDKHFTFIAALKGCSLFEE